MLALTVNPFPHRSQILATVGVAFSLQELEQNRDDARDGEVVNSVLHCSHVFVIGIPGTLATPFRSANYSTFAAICVDFASNRAVRLGSEVSMSNHYNAPHAVAQPARLKMSTAKATAIVLISLTVMGAASILAYEYVDWWRAFIDWTLHPAS